MNTAHTLYWSVRREVWEHRSVYVAPLAAAGVVLLGFAIRSLTLPRRMRGLAALDAAQQTTSVILPFSMAAMVIMFTTFVVALFYCLDALYGERRDRSILFWKSLPVSDFTTVLAKACIPLVWLPLQASALVLATQAVMLVVSLVVLLLSGAGAGTLWRELPIFPMFLIQLYGLAAHAAWHAPLYAWLLLVSAWARRSPFLWALLPPLALGALEHIAFGSSKLGALIRHRVMGGVKAAFEVEPGTELITRLSQLAPARFLTRPGLWIGLAFAGAFFALAVRLRRQRDPI